MKLAAAGGAVGEMVYAASTLSSFIMPAAARTGSLRRGDIASFRQGGSLTSVNPRMNEGARPRGASVSARISALIDLSPL
ncbi:unnamed protein product [Rangifer tarandus platyrhynchus]|uniref:Uncharacterized protein n=2 Tax=Rangifer tarandus platyrhynchus TaxID=3082113 RepID=A0AC60A2P7_RANTA|nr:unnamed protein product [Rangifer tarandus platyrhynchus]